MTVPGAVRGWWDLHQRFGRLPWKDLFQPAIDLARRGIVVSAGVAEGLKLFRGYYQRRDSEVFIAHGRKYPDTVQGVLKVISTEGKAGGEAPKEGDVWVRTALADSLSAVAEVCRCYPCLLQFVVTDGVATERIFRVL